MWARLRPGGDVRTTSFKHGSMKGSWAPGRVHGTIEVLCALGLCQRVRFGQFSGPRFQSQRGRA